MKKRVLIVSESLGCSNNAVGQRMESFLRVFKKTGKVACWVLDSRRIERPEVISSGSRFYSGYVKRKKNFIARLIFEVLFSIEFLVFIIANRKRFDTIFISSPPYFFSLNAATFCKILRVNVIFDTRDLYPEVYVMSGLVRSNNPLYKLLSWYHYRVLKTLKIACATHGIEKYLQSKGVTNTAVYLNGSSLRLDHDHDQVVKYDKFSIVFHGTLGKFQMPGMLLNIATEYKDLFNLLIFTDNEIDVSELDNVFVSNQLPLDRLGQELRRCHLGISLRDNSFLSQISNPVKLFDYINLNIPSVAYPCSEVCELTQDTGLVKCFGINQEDDLRLFLARCASDGEFFNSSFNTVPLRESHKFDRDSITEKFISESEFFR